MISLSAHIDIRCSPLQFLWSLDQGYVELLTDAMILTETSVGGRKQDRRVPGTCRQWQNGVAAGVPATYVHDSVEDAYFQSGKTNYTVWMALVGWSKEDGGKLHGSFWEDKAFSRRSLS